MLDIPEIMCLVLSKLPENVGKKWKRKVVNIKIRHPIEPDFADLIQFVDNEAILANAPLFSEEYLNGYVDRKEVPN